ncbi:diguanylate cyclase/phosphodiesterase with PAS/PAC sensor(s) [Leptothrix cholodnii SP-6]|uniref:Diguanylate cyclase/phosphodiesterase with PAS/PAC sensor(S) n=1 Tax=Leptothrix cholodnii (strain ATCC 51168 / LMG 8142 / SP-6) TaxID=395495 RepID=B1XYG5_LEPCP|nr:EAL domain-containing protein [Leptothrix cholodnii]ACB35210.1 diguanylate cyclase/phosphodiesterase with PAS/PAC sensor(s) [Leptothrix cholodnii SP-6]
MSHRLPPPLRDIESPAGGPAAQPTVEPALQQLLAGLIEAACVVDARALHLLAANAAACDLWGCSLPELLGRPVVELAVTPEDQLFWLDLEADPGQHDVHLHSDSLIERGDGSLRVVERRVSLIRLACGSPAWLLVLVDQQNAQQLADEVSRLASELGATLESSHEAILVTDLNGQVRSHNAAFATLWRLGDDDDSGADDGTARTAGARLTAQISRAMADPLGYETLLDQRQASLSAPLGATEPVGARCATDRLLLADGRTFERRLVPQYGRGQAVGWVQVWRDLSLELAQQARLQVAAQVFEASLDALIVTDAQHRIVATNPVTQALTGLDAGALQGRTLASLLADTMQAQVISNALAELPRLGHWQGELTLGSPLGALPVQAHLIDMAGLERGGAGGCIVVLRDLRERLAQERRLRELALTDALTGLPNRLQLDQKVRDEVQRCQKATGGFALLLFGLDRFTHINDSLGHGCGDRVLVEVARRLSANVRLGDAVARLGGDSFVMMLKDSDAAAAEPIARRLLEQLAEPLALDGLRLTIKASVGIALFPADGADADNLLKNADSAMHRVKERQGGALRFYQPQMNDDLLARMQLDHAMRQALARGEFRLHYQPQLDLHSGAVIGAEGLCRWRDAERGEVSPGRFIPVAEETGFIAELGHWVLCEAVAQAASWRRQGLRMPVSVNVSALQFQAAGFVDSVAGVLAQAQLPAELLELELTESILLGDIDEIVGQLQRLADLGVKLAIDDFGTGYSSLRYLKRLPIHRLKIDRDFIRRLPDDPSDAAITRTIVDLGRALHLQVIAEGVETPEQHACLAAMGCHEYQGFLFAPALPATQFEALLRQSLRRLA